MSKTFYWHDYETWGADSRRDWPCQFAGLRTDEDLNPLGDPLDLYCRPADDLLPQPDACLVTNLSPLRAWRKGVVEAEFAARIERELAAPGTCGVGYNSIRFDDEFTRNLFYRNFIDPYARERQNGNSRWDLIDVLRLAHALRPQGIAWPKGAEGLISFRLEDLVAANGIDHGQAHEALADVRATLALARLLKSCQPRLFDYALSLRDQDKSRDLLTKGQPLLHVSARYPARLGCIAPVLPITPDPVNHKGFICFDLRHDPRILLDLTPAEIRERLFTRTDDLPEGVERIPLKTVHVNRVPMLAPMATLTPAAAERWAIDPDDVQRHAKFLREAKDLAGKLGQAYQSGDWPKETDPDLLIYGGGFFPEADRRLMIKVRQLSPRSLAEERFAFVDRRLPTMLFRYRARNWPETLSPKEREEWDAWRFERLTDPEAGASITVDKYLDRIAVLRSEHERDEPKQALLDDLVAWCERIMDVSE